MRNIHKICTILVLPKPESPCGVALYSCSVLLRYCAAFLDHTSNETAPAMRIICLLTVLAGTPLTFAFRESTHDFDFHFLPKEFQHPSESTSTSDLHPLPTVKPWTLRDVPISSHELPRPSSSAIPIPSPSTKIASESNRFSDSISGSYWSRTPGFVRSFIAAHAHSHNDYEQRLPLSSALQHGIRSIEVDVYPPKKLSPDSKLLVAHAPWDIDEEKDIDNIYIEPISRYIESSRASIQRKRSRETDFIEEKRVTLLSPFFHRRRCLPQSLESLEIEPIYLLVDIKRDPETVLPMLTKSLGPIAEHVTTFGPGGLHRRAVTVLLSGNLKGVKDKISSYRLPRSRSPSSITRGGGTEHLGQCFFIDGRVPEISKVGVDCSPLVSVDYRLLRLSSWMRMRSRDCHLRKITHRANLAGKRVRVFACGNDENIWDRLLGLGESNGHSKVVDVVSVDDHDKFEKYVLDRLTGKEELGEEKTRFLWN